MAQQYLSWSYVPPVSQPGAPVQSGGGGGVGTGYRDLLDAKRSGYLPVIDQVPSAQYPDGYLGTINTRREDRVLAAIQEKLSDRSYQRGVHKFTKLPAGDYVWPKEFGPMTGLEHQARGKRWTAKGSPVERLAHGGKYAIATPEELGRIASQYGVVDPELRRETDPSFPARMRRYLPTWM